MKKLAIFGSTGSIGRQVLEVVKIFPDVFRVVSLGARSNTGLLNQQINEFLPKYVYIHFEEFRKDVFFDDKRIFSGYSGIKKICGDEEVDIVIVAVDGFSGVFPTIEGLKNNKKVLTANKESIFVWGKKIVEVAKQKGIEIIPLDSEHNTIFNIIKRVGRENVDKIILTASGGPFLDTDMKELENVDISQALAHPNWNMGKVVTLNSATMFNKFLEVFEAKVFFDVSLENIQVVVHPQSRIHSMVMLKDKTIWSIFYKPLMIYPIASAMFYPEIPSLKKEPYEEIPLNVTLEFKECDLERFKILRYLRIVDDSTTSKKIVLNLANEICLDLFSKGKIKFPQIIDISLYVFENFDPLDFHVDSIDEDLEKRIEIMRDNIKKYILENFKINM